MYNRIFILISCYLFSLQLMNAQNTWQVLKDWGKAIAYKGEFSDSNNAMIIREYDGKSLITKTSDGGLTWLDVFTDPPDTGYRFWPNQLQDMSYPEKDYAFVTAWYGNVVKTTDGGKTWNYIKVFQSDTEMYKGEKTFASVIGMYDRNHGVAIFYPWSDSVDAYSCITNDGWKTWQQIDFKLPEGMEYAGIYKFICLSPTKYIASVDSDLKHGWGILRSEDQGRTWKKSYFDTLDPLSQRPSRISFLDSLNGWSVSGTFPKQVPNPDYKMTVSRTTDGGKSWVFIRDTTLRSRYHFSIYDACFKDSLNGVVLVDYPLRTTNGGKTWVQDKTEVSMDPTCFIVHNERGGRFALVGSHKLQLDIGIITSVKEELRSRLMQLRLMLE